MECGRLVIGHHEIVASKFSVSQMLYIMGAPTESLTDCINPCFRRRMVFAYYWTI